MVFSGSHIRICELDHKECWAQRTDAFKLWFWGVWCLKSPLDCKEIKPVNPKGNQEISWLFIGKTDAEAEVPILWPPDSKSWLIGKDPDAGKDWRQEEKGTTEHETVGWHHQLDGHEFEQAPGIGDGQESLACCSPWGHKEYDTTEWLNWIVYIMIFWFTYRDLYIYVHLCIPTGKTFTHIPMWLSAQSNKDRKK